MAKYKVLQSFKDISTKEKYQEGQEIEMTVKRANEAIENLKKWNGEFLERIDNKEDNEENDDEEDTDVEDEEENEGDE